MAKKFLTGLTLVNLDSDPLVGSEGELYFNTSASVAKIYKAGAWTELGAGGGGGGVTISESAPSSPTIGDLWYQASTGSLSVWDDTYWVEVNGVIEGGGGAGIIVSTTAPESPETGTGWYNNTTGVLAVWDGTYWVEVNGVIQNDPVTQEQIQDYVAPLLDHANHTNITATYDDLNNQILLSASAGGGTSITVSETAPASPEEGEGWFNNVTGSFYIYDGSYWVEVNGIIDGLTEDQVQDYVAPLFAHNSHTNVIATYDDLNNKIILNTSASITNIDSIRYPDFIAFDTTPETSSASVGTLFWDSGDGIPKAILSPNVQLGVGQESVALVKNATGSSISKGSVVYINGAQGQRPTVALSSASAESTSSKTFGITAETIADGAEGFVVTEGILRGVNTGGLTQGSPLWLSVTNGQYTQTMPTQPNHSVFLGYVVKAHPTSGEIFVKIQNGYELQELHNVKITDVQDQDLIVYSSASGLWINTTNQSIINSASAAAVSAASGIFATQAYVNEISDITPLDNIKSRFDGFETRFLPTYLGNFVNITNPYRLILNINGIIQVVDYPELVWQSPLPRQGFWIDNEGYIVFSEAPPPGSTFDARLMAGSTTTTKTKLLYPFEPVDILLGE